LQISFSKIFITLNQEIVIHHHHDDEKHVVTAYPSLVKRAFERLAVPSGRSEVASPTKNSILVPKSTIQVDNSSAGNVQCKGVNVILKQVRHISRQQA